MASPISNKTLTDEQFAKYTGKLGDGENLVFLLFGDLDDDSRYLDRALGCTGGRLVIFDSDGGIMKTVPVDTLTDVRVKRMYGNAALRARVDGEDTILFRCTYRAVSHLEIAAQYITALAQGVDAEDKFGALYDSFEKEAKVCPNCGRTLPSAGAKCYNCSSKSKIIAQFWKYIKPHTGALIVSLILSVVATGIPLLPPLFTKMLVDDIIPNRDEKSLYIVIGCFFASYLVLAVVQAIRNYQLRVVGNKIVADLKTDVYVHAQYLPMKFYDKTSTGSVITRINSDTATLQSFIMRISQEVIIQFFLLIGIIFIMLLMDWKMTLLALCPVPVIVLATKNFAKSMRPFYRRIWLRSAAISSVLTDSIPCIKVIKSFTGEKAASEKFKSYTDEWFETDKRFAPVISRFTPIMTFVINIGELLIWFIGGRNVIHGVAGLTLGTLVSLISYTVQFYGPVNFFATLSDSFQSASTAAERIMDILEAEPEHDFGQGNIPERIEGKIEFENVNFAFDRSKKVLTDVNVTIEKGDVVGIVGTTGSGKSTMVNLLMRFYDGYDGRILVDGMDIRDIDLSYWRSCIGYVQQDPMMFHDTVFNNIAYGLPGATPEQVIEAADIANAHEFITRCPDGYDSVLGERGVGLSGGERQRVSIARAVLKNPAILVFDEATAAVDSETEHLIQEAIDRLIAGRTTIMIAHRLSTLAKANKIIVVDHGRIIECGTPAELLALRGKYYNLVQIQSQGVSDIKDADLLAN